jgi:hypothetical protein
METAMKDTSELKDEFQKESQPVYKMSEPKIDVTCYCCGAKGHMRPDCHYRKDKCDICGCTGHLRAVCHDKKEGYSRQGDRKKRGQGYKGKPDKIGKQPKSEKTLYMSADTASGEEDDVHQEASNLFHLEVLSR